MLNRERMKNNLLIKKLRIPIYQSSLWIVVCPSIPKAIDYVEDQINTKVAPPEVGSVTAYTYSVEKENGARRFVLFLRPKSKPGEIAHECKHLVNHIFSWHGISLSLTNDEHECYYLDHLVEQAHNTIKQWNKLHTKPKALYTLRPLKIPPVDSNT